MSIGTRITELRNACGMSQYALAKTMEVSRQAVSKWETDRSIPNPKLLIQLAEVLNTDVEYLTTGRVTQKPLPVVINSVETVERIVEKPAVQIVEKVIEKPVVEFVERPVVKKVYRKEYLRNPFEFTVVGTVCLVMGFLIGLLF